MPHYVALNHIGVLLCHNFKFDVLEVQGEVIFIEILWKQKRTRWERFSDVQFSPKSIEYNIIATTKHDIVHFSRKKGSPVTWLI